MAQSEAADLKDRLERALALQKAGRLEEAGGIYTRILETEPDCADAWHLLGLIELERFRAPKALELIGRALELKPKSSVFHHNIAGALGQLGRLTEAEEHYREAIRRKPDYAEAYYNLSSNVKFAPGDPVIAPIEEMLRERNLDRADRCFLHFAAGKYFDDVADPDRAIYHYHMGNARKGARYDPQADAAFFADTMKVLDGEFLRARFGGGVETELPVFIVGMPRSGTTLDEQILASHPLVPGAGERPELRAAARGLAAQTGGGAYPGGLAGLDSRAFQDLALRYLKAVTDEVLDAGAAQEALRVVDKHPLNFRYLGLIALTLPGARIIHCRRDPRDTCLSCYFQNFVRGQEYSFYIPHLAFFYRAYERLMAHWREVLPSRLFEVRYEELVAEPERVSRAMVDFCGLDWDPACLAFHETERPVVTASRWQVRQPIYTSSLRRWQRYERHLTPLLDALGPLADYPES